MSCTVNGHAMSIGYGEAGTVSDTLAIGRNYCHRHLGRIPTLTREQMVRLGCVFPSAPPKLPERPRKNGRYQARRAVSDNEVAMILAGHDAGKTMKEIADEIGRRAPVVRYVLLRHKRDTSRRPGAVNPLRVRVLALLGEGAHPADIATVTGAALGYVRNIASAARKEAA